MGFLIKKSINFQVIASQISKDIGFVGIKTKNQDYYSVYLPPTSVVRNGFNELETVIKKNRTTFILGDFNIDMMNQANSLESSPCERFNDFCRNMTLYPVVKNPTRVTDKTATLIDNILTNSTSLLTCGVMTADVADHLCPFAIRMRRRHPKTTNRCSNGSGKQNLRTLKN